jgi:MATE family multidrug resistance protein
MGEEEAAAPLLVPGSNGDDPRRLNLTLAIHGDDDEWKAAGEAAASSARHHHALPAGWDWAEVRGQLAFAAPMVTTNMAYYAIPLVSVMYAGRLGDLQLAAATLGNSWGTVTGIALMVRTYVRHHLDRIGEPPIGFKFNIYRLIQL